MDPRNAWSASGAEEDEMGIDRSRGFDVTTSERILAGEDVGPRDLVSLLALAAAPPRGSETAGEEAAVMGFRAARHRPAERGNRKPVVVRWATLLGAKTAAALAIAVAATGAALAAGTGVLPNPFADLNSPPTAPASDASHSGTGSRVSGSFPPSSPGVPSTAGGPPATVPASMIGLCQGYLAQEEKEPGSAATSPAFASLVAAAGAAENVPAYCAIALAQDPANGAATPTPHATGPPAPLPTPTQGGGEKLRQNVPQPPSADP